MIFEDDYSNQPMIFLQLLVVKLSGKKAVDVDIVINIAIQRATPKAMF
jgi:hypothetical protein